MVVDHTDWLGNSTDGVHQGRKGKAVAVTFMTLYGDSSYLFGIQLTWDATTTKMYGTATGTGVDFDLTGDPVTKVDCVFSDSNIRGITFYNSNSSKTVGLTGTNVTAFDGFTFVDMEAYKGVLTGNHVIWGLKFYYLNPSLSIPRIFAGSALAITAHTWVVAKSFMKVGKLRSSLAIKAPSCDPPLTTSPSDAQLWYRTFRAQENCKEMFLVYLPSMLIASTMGYYAFGRWAPRMVGTLGLLGAFFRYKYLNAYIEDAELRGKPFHRAMLCMKPIFFLAVASSGYLVGKELYHTIRGRVAKEDDS